MSTAATLVDEGNALLAGGHPREAIDAYRRALALEPRPEIAGNLAVALRASGAIDAAESTLRGAIDEAPANATLRSLLGSVHKAKGRIDEALAAFDLAVRLAPDDAALGSNRLFALHYADVDVTRLADEARAWGRRHAAPLAPALDAHRAHARAHARRLRVGFVSPDFREHCQSLFTAPLLAALDRDALELFAYSDVAHPDATTSELRARFDHFRDATTLDDAALATRVRADRIDVLVDLTMHMAGNRLLAFARKPAPVQLSWLAYPGSTGVAAIDHRLGDPYLDPSSPDGDEPPWVEDTLRLPDSFWCYDPRATPIDPGPPPSARAGYVTFGCLNNFCKVNDATLRRFARVLDACPGARLRLLAPLGEARERPRRVLAAAGIDPARLEFVDPKPRPAYLAEWGDVDVALDTLPYNGHTTSLDAWWMGVPVVSLVGGTPAARAGLSQACNLGLRALVADDDEAFTRIARALADDAAGRSALRATLRARFDASPLRDGARFARSFEAAVRDAFRRFATRP